LFWHFALAYRGSATPHVLPRVLFFAAIAAVITVAYEFYPVVAVPVGPIEVSGAALGLILILRTNAGYDRWWEGRKLWGGIVNQTRNVAIAGLAYGPSDPSWRQELVRWSAAFPHVIRRSLRRQRDLPEVVALVGEEATQEVARAEHMPSFTAQKLASVLRDGRLRQDGLDGFGFLQTDKERALLMDHVGACERILKTPLPYPYSVAIERFIVVYLLLAPFGLLESAGRATPFVMLLIASPILVLDYIGTQLQDPFSQHSLGHLPLDEICATIQGNVLAMLEQPAARGSGEDRALDAASGRPAEASAPSPHG
jgi:putative membrane protein